MPPSSRLRPLLATLALVLGTWAGVVWITGGVAFTVAGLRVSSRSATRPALLAAVLLAGALWGWAAGDRRRHLARARHRGDAVAPWAAALAALALAVTSAAFGGHVAGGADASGYVSQSRLWAEGHVRVSAPALAADSWPTRGWLVAPLGYAPSSVEGELGPTYAPGLPWLMAAGAAVAGEVGRYVWTPLFAGLLTWGTFLLSRRAAPPLVAFGAAMIVATSPPVLFAAMQTMSDLPAAALWLGALLLLDSPRAGGTLVSGTLAALALVVRPNLVLVAGAVWVAGLVAAPACGGARPGDARGAVGDAGGIRGGRHRRGEHRALGVACGLGLRRQRRPLPSGTRTRQPGARVALDDRHPRLLERAGPARSAVDDGQPGPARVAGPPPLSSVPWPSAISCMPCSKNGGICASTCQRGRCWQWPPRGPHGGCWPAGHPTRARSPSWPWRSPSASAA